ncbi:MAG: type II secretion system F family protein [Clostridiaceae bacterium]|nr:type II secretion system F family protein [Clostridiaceae bacterium]
MRIKKKKPPRPYNARELSAFCLQISLLLDAGMPIDSTMDILAEDAAGEEDRENLALIADAVAGGTPFDTALADAGLFPCYLLRMTKVGRKTGTLDVCMRRLSEYYSHEDALERAVRSAVVYPMTMVLMLLAVLFVLLTRVIPVFERVYEQKGASLSAAAEGAVHAGTVLTVVCFAFLLLAAALFAAYRILGARGTNPLYRKARAAIWRKSAIVRHTAVRRFAEVLALSLQSGLGMPEGFTLAADVIVQEDIRKAALKGAGALDGEQDFMDVLRGMSVFSKRQMQMIAVGNRSGQLDEVMERIARDSAEAAEEAIETAVGRLEPTLVAVMSVSVGLILLAVMLPLIGMLATIG